MYHKKTFNPTLMIYPIPGYESMYSIDRDGTIYSHKNNKTTVLKPRMYPNGYMHIKFRKNGKEYSELVHRLIAYVFISKPAGKDFINHKNGIKHDNRIENLEWVTKSENMFHASRVLGKMRYERKQRKIMDTQTGKIYSGAQEMSATTGISRTHCANLARGIHKTRRYEYLS
jgi:hypothetical protein